MLSHYWELKQDEESDTMLAAMYGWTYWWQPSHFSVLALCESILSVSTVSL